MEPTEKLVKSFHVVIQDLCEEFVERDDLIRTCIRTMIAQKHLFMIGEPGTGKSLLVKRILARIGGLEEQDYFKRLMTAFTIDDEIFGPPDLELLNEKGKLRRRTHNRLPVAHFAFLDEGPRANSSVLNALLTAMNEREFDDEEGIKPIPLKTMFMAANTLLESEELEALWDRLHIRRQIFPIQDASNFLKMWMAPPMEDVDPVITLDDLIQAHDETMQIVIPVGVGQALVNLKQELTEHEFHVTDRRWNDTRDIIRAEAWLNGRGTATVNDTRPLRDMLWDRIEDRKEVHTLVTALADPLEREASDRLNALHELVTKLEEDISKHLTDEQKYGLAVETYDKMIQEKRGMVDLKTKAGEDDISTLLVIEEFMKLHSKAVKTLYKHGFGVDDPEVIKMAEGGI